MNWQLIEYAEQEITKALILLVEAREKQDLDRAKVAANSIKASLDGMRELLWEDD